MPTSGGPTTVQTTKRHRLSITVKGSEHNDETNEDVMSEMQTLTVNPQLSDKGSVMSGPNKKQVIDDSLKHKILNWLISEVRLLKSMNEA